MYFYRCVCVCAYILCMYVYACVGWHILSNKTTKDS